MTSDTSTQHWQTLVQSGIISDQIAQIFFAFLQIQTPVTDSEMASSLHHDDPHKVRRRRSDLYSAGAIQRHPKRKCQVTGMTVYTWNVTPGVTFDNFKALMATAKDNKKKKNVCPTCNGTGKVKVVNLDFLELDGILNESSPNIV